VNAKNAKNFADGVVHVLNDMVLRQRLIDAGYAHVRKYSWGRMAGETLKIYERNKVKTKTLGKK